jgi:hypothetical protein
MVQKTDPELAKHMPAASWELCERLAMAEGLGDFHTNTNECADGSLLLSQLLWAENRRAKTVGMCLQFLLATVHFCDGDISLAQMVLPGLSDDAMSAYRKLHDAVNRTATTTTVATVNAPTRSWASITTSSVASLLTGDTRTSDASIAADRSEQAAETIVVTLCNEPLYFKLLTASARAIQELLPVDRRVSDAWLYLIRGPGRLPPHVLPPAQLALASRTSLDLQERLASDNPEPLTEQMAALAKERRSFYALVAVHKNITLCDECQKPLADKRLACLASECLQAQIVPLNRLVPANYASLGAAEVNSPLFERLAFFLHRASHDLSKAWPSKISEVCLTVARLNLDNRRHRQRMKRLVAEAFEDGSLPQLIESLRDLLRPFDAVDPQTADTLAARLKNAAEEAGYDRPDAGDEDIADDAQMGEQDIIVMVRHPVTDVTVIVDALLLEEEIAAVIDPDVDGPKQRVAGFALPLDAIFRVTQERSADSPWWRPYVAEKTVTYVRQAEGITAVADDRVRLVCGRELLMGLCSQHILVRSKRHGILEYNVHRQALSVRHDSTSSTSLLPLKSYVSFFTRDALRGDTTHTTRQCQIIGLHFPESESGLDLGDMVRGTNLLRADVPAVLGFFQLRASKRLYQEQLRRSSGSYLRRSNELKASIERNPLFTDFMPRSLRVLADEAHPLLLDADFWKRRLNLEPGDPAGRLLLELLSEPSATLRSVLYVLRADAFSDALSQLQSGHGNLASNLSRPVVLRLTLARSNLASLRSRLLKLQEQRCYTLVFLSIGEKMPPAALARLVQPFLDTEDSPLKLVLEYDQALIDSLRLSDIGQRIQMLKTGSGADADNSAASSPACVMFQNPQHALLFEAVRGTDLKIWAKDDFNALIKRNAHLRCLQDEVQSMAQPINTSDADGLTCIFVVLADATAFEATEKILRQSLGEDREREVLTLNCAASNFYEMVDSVITSENVRSAAAAVQRTQTPRRHPQGRNRRSTTSGTSGDPCAGDDVLPDRQPCVIITGFNLLMQGEKVALRDRLHAANFNAIFCASTMQPVDTQLLGGRAKKISVFQFSAASPTLPLLELSGHTVGLDASMKRALWIAQCILGRHLSYNVAEFFIQALQQRAVPTELAKKEARRFDDLDRELRTEVLRILDAASLHVTSKSTPWDRLVHAFPAHQKWDAPSFDQFSFCATTAQVCPQDEQFRLWLGCIRGDEVGSASDGEGLEDIERLLRRSGGLGMSLLQALTSSNVMSDTRGEHGQAQYFSTCRISGTKRLAWDLLPAAVRGEELPWNDIVSPLGQYPPSARSLVEMLCACPRPLLFAVALPPRALHAALQSASDDDLSRLSRRLSQRGSGSENEGESVPHIEFAAWLARLIGERILAAAAKPREEQDETHGQIAHPALLDAMAALAVLFFNVVHQQSRQSNPDNKLALMDVHVQLLMRSGLYFRMSMGAERTLLPILLGLDGPLRLFVDQADINRWLQAGCSTGTLDAVLARPATLGRAIIETILHPTFTDRQQPSVLSQTTLAKEIYAILQGRSPAAAAVKFPLTPNAVGCLLERMSEDSIRLLPRILKRPRDTGAELSDYIVSCVTRGTRMLEPVANALAFIECWAEDLENSRQLPRTPSLDDGDAVLLRVLWALAAKSGQIDELVEQWSMAQAAGTALRVADTTNAHDRRDLPLDRDELKAVRVSLLNHWEACLENVSLSDDADSVWRVLQADLGRLSPSAVCALLATACERLVPEAQGPSSALTRIIVCLWAKEPENDLPLQPEEFPRHTRIRQDAWRLLRDLAASPRLGLDMVSWVEQHSDCSLLAIYLTAPGTLPLNLRQSFECRFEPGHGSTGKQRRFLFAQKHQGRDIYVTSYMQSTNGRPVLEQLLDRFKPELLRTEVSANLGKLPQDLIFVVDRGCCLDIMKSNFLVYATLTHVDWKPVAADFTERPDVVYANARYALNLLYLWFGGLQIGDADLFAAVEKTTGQPPSFAQLNKDDVFIEKPLSLQAPCLIDTYLHRERGLLTLFGPSDADSAMTVQTLNAFLPPQDAFPLSTSRVQLSMSAALSKLIQFCAGQAETESIGVEAENLATVFASTLCRFAAEGGVAREEALKASTYFGEAVANVKCANKDRLTASLFRWTARGIGFTEYTGLVDRDMPGRPDKSPRQLLRNLAHGALGKDVAVCETTWRELEYFKVVTSESRPRLKKLTLADGQNTHDLDFIGPTDRAGKEWVLELLAAGSAGEPANDVDRVTTLSGPAEFNTQRGYCPDISLPWLTGGRGPVREVDAGTKTDDCTASTGFEGQAEGFVSFDWTGARNKQVVVRAPSLMCLRRATSKDVPLEVDSIDVISGPGGVLACKMQHLESPWEANAFYKFVDKRDLVNSDSLEGYKVQAIFPTHELAFAFLRRQLPANGILVGDGILLKMTARGSHLHPLFLSSEEVAESFTEYDMQLPEALVMGPALNFMGVQPDLFATLETLVALEIGKLRFVKDDGMEDEVVDEMHDAMASNATTSPTQLDETMDSGSEDTLNFDFEADNEDNSGREHDGVWEDDSSSDAGADGIPNAENGAGAFEEEATQETNGERRPGGSHRNAAHSTFSAWVDEQLLFVAKLRTSICAGSTDEIYAEAKASRLEEMKTFCSKLSFEKLAQAIEQTFEGEASLENSFDVWLPSVPGHLRHAATDCLRKGLQELMYKKERRETLLSRFLVDSANKCVTELHPLHFLARSTQWSYLFPGELDDIGDTAKQSSSDGLGFSAYEAGSATKTMPPVDKSRPSVLCPPCCGKATYLAKTTADTEAVEGHILYTKGEIKVESIKAAWLVRCISSPLKAEVMAWLLNQALQRPCCLQLAPHIRPSLHFVQALVAYALADACPFKDRRPYMLNAYTPPDPVPSLFGHVSGTYGMYVCSEEALLQLQLDLKAPVRIIDFHELRARGIVADDQIFAHLMNLFSHTTLVLYVRGCNRASDQLLKWCAEHSKAVPYHYFYFEELDLSRNFSEIRDRFNKDHYQTPSLEETRLLNQRAHLPALQCSTMPSDSPANDESGVEERLRTEETTYLNHEIAMKEGKHFLLFLERFGFALENNRLEFDFDTTAQAQSMCTSFSGNWKASLKKWIAAGSAARVAPLQVFILISPPGAGKTVFMENYVDDRWKANADSAGPFKGIPPVYFDASSSLLVEEALVALLERQCGDESQPLSLIVDEYHMLKEQQKMQLFNFLEHRSEKSAVRAILVGNRHEKHDRDIVDRWRKGKEENQICFFLCRLPAVHLRARATQLQKISPHNSGDDYVEQLHWWYASARFLFSDDLLTFRNCEEVFKGLAQSNAVPSLQAELYKKSESLGELTCREFSTAVLELYRKCNQGQEHCLSLDPSRAFSDADIHRAVKLLADTEDSPFKLLVKTALLACFAARSASTPLDRELVAGERINDFLNGASSVEPERPGEETSDTSPLSGPEPDAKMLMSFPEFVARLKPSSRMHPIARMSAWVHYVHQEAQSIFGWGGLASTYKDTIWDIPRTQCLRRLRVIDQPGFPLVTAVEAQLCSLTRGLGFSENGDYTDLSWIRASLQHNAAISWRRAKQVWSRNFVSDVEELTRLLEVCPDRASCLTALSPINLTSLLSMSTWSEVGNGLALKVLEVLEDNYHLQATTEASNPFLLVLWLCYLGPSAMRSGADALLAKANDILENQGGQQGTAKVAMLRWAARFAAEVTGAQVQPDRVLARLREDLNAVIQGVLRNSKSSLPAPAGAAKAVVSEAPVSQLWEGILVELFSASFAKLAPDPQSSPLSEAQRFTIFHLAQRCFPGEDDWPSALRELSALLHQGRVSQSDLVRVSQWELFRKGAATGEECELLLPSASEGQSVLARRLLLRDRTERLPACWQRALLTQLEHPWCDEVEQLLNDPTFVRLHFEKGLRTLRRADEIWRGGGWSEHIREMMHQKFVQLHGVRDRSQRLDAYAMLVKASKLRQQQQVEDDMKFLKQQLKVTDASILRFFNRRIGKASIEQAQRDGVEVDEYKNPVGGNFDLCCDGAFPDIKVLIGDFSQEVPYTLFKFSPHAWEAVKTVAASCNLAPESQVKSRFAHHNRELWVQSGFADDFANALQENGVRGCDRIKEEFQRELPLAVLKANVEAKLSRAKGFSVKIVQDEKTFISQLQYPAKAHVAWVLSGSLSSMLRSHQHREEAVLDTTERLVGACQKFQADGGGLFIFAENDPIHWHANAILWAFEGMGVAGNEPGDGYVFAPSAKIREPALRNKMSCGKMHNEDHPILTGLSTLFEGVTVSFPVSAALPRSWKTLVSGGNLSTKRRDSGVPIVLERAVDFSRASRPGRVLLDTAYTKLWLNWNEAGTDRYVASATAYLTGIDLALRVAAFDQVDTTGKMASDILEQTCRPAAPLPNPWTRNRPLLRQRMEKELPPALDIIMVIDMSGSMFSFFDQAREYARKAVAGFKIGTSRNRMGIVAFGTSSVVSARLGSSHQQLMTAIKNLACLGGTSFAPPLRDVCSQFREFGHGNSRRLVLFQTDGGNGDPELTRTAATALINGNRRDGGDAECVAVVVSNNQGVVQNALQVAGKPGRYNDPVATKQADNLVLQISDYNRLVAQMDEIVARFVSAV